MVKHRRRFAPGAMLALICALAPFGALQAQLVPQGFIGWKSLRTEHFWIHFPAGQETFARRTAAIAEKIHAELEPRYKSGATETHIALVFGSDLVNAFATPAGLDQIVLFLDNPQAGDFSRYDLWAELLIRHEYVHILTLRQWDLDRGALAVLRILFGVPPNLLSPPAMIEGAAVYEESRPGKGRVDDPRTRMIVRSAILEDRFPSLTELMIGSFRWPLGNTYYLYGGRLLTFLSEKYGHDFSPNYWARDEIPIDVSGRMRVTSLGRAYADFRESELTEFNREIAAIRARGLTPFERLTTDGFTKDFLYIGADGSPRFFAAPSDRLSGLYRLNPDGDTERLRRVRDAHGFAEAGGRSVYSEEYYYGYGFGFRYELYDGDRALFLKRLAPGRSISYPSLSPDGARLYYIERDERRRYLKSAALNEDDEPTDELVLLQTPLSGILQFTAVSPDGRFLATLVRSGERGEGSLALCDLQRTPATCRRLVGGPGVKAHPRFSTDGKTLYFSSDVDGVYNLYQANVADGAVRRVTNLLGGAFYPAPAEDGLYAIGYSGGGFDVVRFNYADLKAERTDLFLRGGEEDLAIELGAGESEEDNFFGADGELPGAGDGSPDGEIRDYNPFLRFTPYVGGVLGPISSINFVLYGRDPLFRHLLVAGVGLGYPDPVAVAAYDYLRFAGGFGAVYYTNYFKSDRNPGCQREDDPLRFLCDDKYARFEQARAYLRYIDQGRYFSSQILLGYAHQKIRNARQLRSVDYEARDLNLSGPSATILLGDVTYFPESISPELGWTLILETDYYTRPESKDRLDRDLQHSVEYGVAEGGLALYLPSFWSHHVNHLGAYGYGSYGPDREMQSVPLSRLVRGLGATRSPRDHAAAAATYEYRLPLFFMITSLFEDNPSVRLRQSGLHLFADYGTVFDKRPYREDWTLSYGAALTFNLDILWLAFNEMKLTYARGTGPAGEAQIYFSFSAEFSPDIIGAGESSNPITSPYRPPSLADREHAGYFRESRLGGRLR